GYFRQALWASTPMAYLGTYPIKQPKGEPDGEKARLSMDAWPNWNYEPGEWVRVVCYTNAAQAQLVLNGKNVGKPKPYDAEHGIIYWDVPFEPGVLEVLGLNEDGK